MWIGTRIVKRENTLGPQITVTPCTTTNSSHRNSPVSTLGTWNVNARVEDLEGLAFLCRNAVIHTAGIGLDGFLSLEPANRSIDQSSILED